MIRTAAVLGAGTMGAQIAAHLANAGVPVALLDVSREAAADGLKRARALKPDPFFTPEAATRITTGGFEEDLAHACRAEWIVEAIVERLDLKQQLFARVESHRAAGSIVSSNTSGIPVAALADGRGEAFRRHFLGTHFFNPPRYLRLLELIPTADTAGDVRDRVAAFADLQARQRRRGGEGHAQLHRQPSRSLRRAAHLRRAGHGRLHDRGDRCDDRAGARPAAERDLPHARHHRARHPRARRREPGRTRPAGAGAGLRRPATRRRARFAGLDR